MPNRGSHGDTAESERNRGSHSVAANASRGVIYIALAKVYFILAGALIEFRLPVILANTVFGAYAVVAATISPFNNVLVTGSIQAVSRFTAQKPELARAIQASGLRMHLGLGLPLAICLALASPLIARFLHDPGKTAPLMLAAVIVAGYSFYAVMVGTANGRREFHKQAFLDVCFATLRATGILGLASLGLGILGAIGGWVAAVAVILVIAALLVGIPRATDGRYPISPLARFFAAVAVYLVLLNLIMSADQLLLKRFTAEWFAANPDALATHAMQALTPASAADGQVGYYRAVQNLARLSYQVIIAAMFVIFPLVSHATFNSDRDVTRRYIRTTMRYSFIFATAVAVVMASNPQAMLDVVYPIDYARTGAMALIALAFGNVAFCLFAVAGTILNGAGLTRQAVIVAAITLGTSVIANSFVIPSATPGTEVLFAAACATAGAMCFGAICAAVMLVRHLGAFAPAMTLVRVPIAVAVAWAVAYLIPFESAYLTLLEGIIVGLSYFAALVIIGELGRQDIRTLTSGRRRKKNHSEPSSKKSEAESGPE